MKPINDRDVFLITGIYALIILFIASVMLMGGVGMKKYKVDWSSAVNDRTPLEIYTAERNI